MGRLPIPHLRGRSELGVGAYKWAALISRDRLSKHGEDRAKGHRDILNYWMRQSGLADLLPSLDGVYVGLSAGSMVIAASIGQFFVGWTPPAGSDETLGIVDFSMFPHLVHEDLPHNTMVNTEHWAAEMTVPAHAVDDETTIQVVDGNVEVISEGQWKLFNPS